MNGLPVIRVQLVHIQGPLKGQIQEVTESVITIGRNPSSTVLFPADTATISRKHAELVREGNRYKIVDHSANGTYVNGKKVTEAFLKDGDVLMFTEGGPKMSFLATITDEIMPVQESAPPVPLSEPEPVSRLETPAPVAAPAAPVMSPAPQAARPPVPPAQKPADIPPRPQQPQRQTIQKVQAPLIIQFGPTLRTYKELPVTIGRKTGCEFVLMHPSIADEHAQIFFSQNQYWIRDLTGKGSITVNGAPVGFEIALKPQDIISFTPQGPALSFLGEGRLAEYEDVQEQEEAPAKPATPAGEEKKSKSFLKDLFRK